MRGRCAPAPAASDPPVASSANLASGGASARLAHALELERRRGLHRVLAIFASSTGMSRPGWRPNPHDGESQEALLPTTRAQSAARARGSWRPARPSRVGLVDDPCGERHARRQRRERVALEPLPLKYEHSRLATSITPSSICSISSQVELRRTPDAGRPLRLPLQMCSPRTVPLTPAKQSAIIAAASAEVICPMLIAIPIAGASSCTCAHPASASARSSALTSAAGRAAAGGRARADPPRAR